MYRSTTTTKPQVHVAIPALDELEFLPACLESLDAQTRAATSVWICVNQPESWWSDPLRRDAAERNAATLTWISSQNRANVTVLDRSSPGNGWTNDKAGVGAARKLLFETILAKACGAGPGGRTSHEPEPTQGQTTNGSSGRTANRMWTRLSDLGSGPESSQDLIVSLDADTTMDPGYLESVVETFARHPGATGLAARYHHGLTGDEAQDRAMLRYELYLRYTFCNLLDSATPFAFTAMGSAIAFPVWAYQRSGGMQPRSAAEDFYLLQKLAKLGPLALWTDRRVHPSSRPSRRVPMGTGPAVARGIRGDWGPYHFFAPDWFDEVAAAIASFSASFDDPGLHEKDWAEDGLSQVTTFLGQQLRCEDPWATLRRNHRDRTRFVRACHERFDGLRILQYLRRRWADGCQDQARCDEQHLTRFLERRAHRIPDRFRSLVAPFLEGAWRFETASVESLDALRHVLAEWEDEGRRKRQETWHDFIGLYGATGHEQGRSSRGNGARKRATDDPRSTADDADPSVRPSGKGGDTT